MAARRAQFVEQPLTAEVSHLLVDVDPAYPLVGLQ